LGGNLLKSGVVKRKAYEKTFSDRGHWEDTTGGGTFRRKEFSLKILPQKEGGTREKKKGAGRG